MRTQITRGRGKLYSADSEQSVFVISYQIHEEFASEVSRWWGEFTLTGRASIRDNAQHVILLEDGRKGRCHVKKMVNRVARSVPPRFVYHFTGITLLE